MPFDKRKIDNGWEVYNSDTGDVKGTHESEGDADGQLAALYANVPDAEKVAKSLAKGEGDAITPIAFIPITKVDAQRHEVWGWGAVEEPDHSDEIFDYASSKPEVLKWSQSAEKRSGGKSKGNVRSMHQPIAAGKLIDIRADDVSKGFFLGAKITDDNEWKKVEDGTYTGFSVGGSYLRRWMDPRIPGKTRYTARPAEWSLVDAPCIPSATFEMVKADGMTATVPFKSGTGINVIRLEKWEEDEHPRDHGKFSSKEGGEGEGSAPEKKTEGKKQQEVFKPSEDKPFKVPTEKLGNFLYYRRGGELYRAPHDAIPDVDGMPMGGRFEAPSHLADMRMNMIREDEKRWAEAQKMNKADAPSTPAPIAQDEYPTDIDHKQDIEIQHMPEPNAAIELNPDNPPSQDALASTTVKAESMEALASAWMPAIGKLVKEATAEALQALDGMVKKAVDEALNGIQVERKIKVEKSETPSAPANARMISVVRKSISSKGDTNA